MNHVLIETPRFVLRELTEDDASDKYLGWFDDPQAKSNISTASQMKRLNDLRTYIAERTSRDDVFFLGIFDSVTGTHIGNVKYEPVDSVHGYAVMGILVGDPAYRGKGVATEVLGVSGRWLAEHRGISEIVLGVRCDNAAAIRSYEKVGFRPGHSPHIPDGPDVLTMVWAL